MSKESYVVTKDQEECRPAIKEVCKPQGGNLRRHSTGAICTKPQVKSRYRGSHHVSSTHDYCKYEKTCDQNDAVKPWKMVRRRSVEGSDLVKLESSVSRRHSLGSRQIPDTKLDTKRDVLALKKTPCASVTSETSSVREDREMARSVDGSRVKSNAKAWKNREPQNRAIEKAPRIKDGESLKVCSIKNVKNKDKPKTQTVRGEDVKEKTVCVVESIIKGVQRDKQTSSEKKTMRIGHKSLTKKEEGGYADLDADPKPERTRVTLAEHLNFKRGKVLETKTEDSGEGSKCEKIVLKHQNVKKEKKIMTLFNSVIEETMIKLMKLKKTKVEALTGAYESLIQDTKKSQHIRSKTTTSSSFGFRTVKNKNTET